MSYPAARVLKIAASVYLQLLAIRCLWLGSAIEPYRKYTDRKLPTAKRLAPTIFWPLSPDCDVLEPRVEHSQKARALPDFIKILSEAYFPVGHQIQTGQL